MLCLRILQAALVYVNTLMLQDVLADPGWSEALTSEDQRDLTPLFWMHVLPYGEVRLDMTSRAQPEPARGHRPADQPVERLRKIIANATRLYGSPQPKALGYFAPGDTLLTGAPRRRGSHRRGSHWRSSRLRPPRRRGSHRRGSHRRSSRRYGPRRRQVAGRSASSGRMDGRHRVRPPGARGPVIRGNGPLSRLLREFCDRSRSVRVTGSGRVAGPGNVTIWDASGVPA